MAEKRYYWLKLKEDFFDDKHIRYLRKLPDGDRLLIVYLRMQLLSLKTEGLIRYSKLLPSCVDELALALDEDLEIVKYTLTALQNVNLVEMWDDQTVYMAAMQKNVGSEGSSAERVRRHREGKVLHSNNGALPDVTGLLLRHGEIEIEIEKDIEKDIELFSKSDDLGKPAPKKKSRKEYNDIGFNRFWQAYPRKMNKPDAIKAWRKLEMTDELLNTILAAVEASKSTDQWQEQDGRFIPYPAS